MVGVYIQSLRILTLCSVLGCVLIILSGSMDGIPYLTSPIQVTMRHLYA